MTGEDVKLCIASPSQCGPIIISDAFYSKLAPIVDQYLQFLESQGNGRWQGIPQEIIDQISSFYQGVDFGRVRFAVNINTVHGQAITIGNDIFFPRDLSLTDREDLQIIFHELEHVGQYARRGGVRPFLAEYIAKIPGKVIAERSFEIHDQLDIEEAAIAKSKVVVAAYYGWDIYLNNACAHGISVAVDYREPNGDWDIDGYWSINANQGYYITKDNTRLHSKNRIFDIYAESTDDSGLVWSGGRIHTVEADNRKLSFREYKISDPSPSDLKITFTCPGK